CPSTISRCSAWSRTSAATTRSPSTTARRSRPRRSRSTNCSPTTSRPACACGARRTSRRVTTATRTSPSSARRPCSASACSRPCCDRRTGRPIWRTRVHSGGSPYYKAPGSPVTVVGSTAFVLTNAGALAAIDAFAGDLRWIRRYERRDPLHDRATGSSRPRSREDFQGAMQFVEQEMRTFLPSDLVTVGGLVILAPCDGHVLMALDGASGEPAWMLEGDSKYAPFGVIRYLVGANSHDLFAA